MRSDPRLTARNGGAIAVQFALLAFGFFGIAAVVIDMRIAVLTQQQMQVAADTAAVEALRQRDAGGVSALREAAQDSVLRTFDDDLDPSNGDALNYGAGPNVRLTGGRFHSNALARIAFDADPVYDPVLEFNDQNAPHGDVVTGVFTDPYPSRSSEGSDYARNDFAPAPPGIDFTTPQPSVLVRLRRTTGRNPRDRESGVSTSGGTLPFLFGLGSLIHAGTNTGGPYNPRADGLTVRSTAIASARKAMQISGPGPALGFEHLQRFAIISGSGQPVPGGFADLWNVLPVGTSFTVDVDVAGNFRAAGAPAAPVLGFFARPASALTLVGLPASPVMPPRPLPVSGATTIVPVIGRIGGDFLVIGFGRIDAEALATYGDGSPQTLRITKRAGQIVPVGASAAAPDALAALTLSLALRTAHSNFPDAVTAPVLER